MQKILGKIVLLAMLIVPLSVPSSSKAATNWDTSGSYVVGFQLTGDPTVYSHDMTLSQDGSDNLTGNGGYPAGSPFTYAWTITSGTVVGDTIDIEASYTLGATCDMSMTGTIDLDGSMSGTWSDDCGGERTGTWETTDGNATEDITYTTIVVSGDTASGENQPGWLFNRDTSTDTPYEFNPNEASIGDGSLYVLPISGVDASDKFIGENFINTPIADVNSISYDFMIGEGGLATEEEHFYMNVYANFGESDDLKYYDCRYDVVPTIGSNGSFTTVTFDPTQAYPVTTRGGANASPYTCPSIPADMDDLSAGSNIRMFALNVGDTSLNDAGLDGYLDNVVVDLDGEVTTYDFEPVITEVVSGGGHINSTGGKGKKIWTFSVQIDAYENAGGEEAVASGEFTLVNHTTKTTCNYDEISGLSISGSTATFTASGADGCTDVDVTVNDLGEPGAGFDTLAVDAGITTTPITGGNFQVTDLE